MLRFSFAWILLCATAPICTATQDEEKREWTDATGTIVFEGDLVGFDETAVVIQTDDKQLINLELEHLSQEDKDFVAAKDEQLANQDSPYETQSWTLKSGLNVFGSVIDFIRTDVVVERRRGKLYVNDRLFNTLPDVYQKMVPKIVNQFENTQLEDGRELLQWAVKQRGVPRTFTCEGVMFELENGDVYGVPFFFFNDDDLQALKPGWDRWEAADDDIKQQEKEALMLEARARAYQRDQEIDYQMRQMNLAMLAVDSGATDLWDVQMVPGGNLNAIPVSCIVMAQNSDAAGVIASRQHPNYGVVGIRKLNRRRGRYYYR